MDLDPGQPNYNLAGQVALLRMGKYILTNADFKEAELIKGYYLNTPTPNLNMKYYQSCTAKLMDDFNGTPSDKKKVLIVNTCGWVEGLGADIQMKIVTILQPQIVVTMTKHNQGLQGNDFSRICRQKHGMCRYFDVVNDPIEGSTNVKGAVQRNRKIINALA
jgi:polynucleotide 5'-kinase involved in rRNA processing